MQRRAFLKSVTALAAGGNGDFFHFDKWRRPDFNGSWTKISLGILD